MTHIHVEVPLDTVPRTQGYECYLFTSGTFELQGDGGFENWAFDGNYTRDPSNGNIVNFQEFTYPAPQSGPNNADGVYLVNLENGSSRASGMAWYKAFQGADPSGNVQPTVYQEINDKNVIIWEANTKTGKSSFHLSFHLSPLFNTNAQ